MSCSPVLFLVFNRPETTARVFERIRNAGPSQLFIAADGPRSGYPEEQQLCAEVRSIVDRVDWPCKVTTLFSDHNLGCRQAVSSAITWFFTNVDSGIILEDDCLPEPSFFKFSTELLAKYEKDSRIGMISGNNFSPLFYDAELSYSFSRHGLIWGWATWKRAWDEYLAGHQLSGIEMDLIKANISHNKHFVEYWWKGAYAAIQGDLDTWDYLWGVTRYRNNFLVIRPKVNLVANIGFGANSTHTGGKADKQYVISEAMQFPLKHPTMVVPDKISDDALEIHLAGMPRTMLQNILNSLSKIWLLLIKWNKIRD